MMETVTLGIETYRRLDRDAAILAIVRRRLAHLTLANGTPASVVYDHAIREYEQDHGLMKEDENAA